MAQNDLLKRYLDAGMAFTQMTQKRAEAIAKDLVRAGELQAEQAQQAAEELLDRSRKNTEKLLELVRREMRAQVANLGLATQDDIARLERKIAAAGTTKSPAKKSPARKRAAKKAPAKKRAPKKASAKKGAARKAPAKKRASGGGA